MLVFIHRRKVEIMHTHSLFTLLGERLMLHTNTVTVTIYNTLYEVPNIFFSNVPTVQPHCCLCAQNV